MYRLICHVTALLILLAAAPRVSAQGGDVVTRTVLVKGIGANEEQAEMDAIVQAVQQVVDMYVEKRQILRDDKVLARILTFVNAKIYSAEQVGKAKKEANGLWRMEMKVSVVVTELKLLLKSLKYAAAEVPGEVIAKKIEVAAKLEKYQEELNKRVSANLEELLEQYSLRRMLKPRELRRPKINADGSIEVQIQLEPDWVSWVEFRRRLVNALEKASGDSPPLVEHVIGPLHAYEKSKAKEYTLSGDIGGPGERPKRLVDAMLRYQAEQKLAHGYYLGVSTGVRPQDGPTQPTRFGWVVFPVKKEVIDALKEIKEPQVKVIVSLVDKKDKVVKRRQFPLKEVLQWEDHRVQVAPFHIHQSTDASTLALVAPVVWRLHPWGIATVRADPFLVKFDLEPDEAKQVARVIVHLE